MVLDNINVDFLLYSCLSVSTDDIRKKEAKEILSFAIRRAYRDASSHVLSIKDKNPRDNKTSDKNPDNIIAKKVNDLTQEIDYDKWHCNLCNLLIDAYSDSSYNEEGEREFSFGIAQKWVNMTMKYLVLLCDICCCYDLGDSKFYKEYGKRIKRDALHAPVDRYIIDAAGKYDTIILPIREDKTELAKRKGFKLSDHKHPSDYIRPWSQWNCLQYCQFQKSLKDTLNAIPALTWESKAWVEQQS